MKRLVIAASIVSMLGTSAVFAQGVQYHPKDKAPYAQQHKGKPSHGNYQPGRPQPGKPHAGHPQAGKPYAGKPYPGHHYGRPAPHRSQWSKGNRLPPQYRHNVVRDYGRYRLAPPPRGYNWVRVNNEYLLIGITTGIISSLIMAN